MKRDLNDPVALGTLIMQHAKLHDCSFVTAADRVYYALDQGRDPLLAPDGSPGSNVRSQHSSAPSGPSPIGRLSPEKAAENGAPGRGELPGGNADFVD